MSDQEAIGLLQACLDLRIKCMVLAGREGFRGRIVLIESPDGPGIIFDSHKDAKRFLRNTWAPRLRKRG